MARAAAYLQDLMLVDRCLDGEQAAARELFRQQHRRIQASLYRILGSNRDMDDLLQETFIQVFGSLGKFRGEARLSTWIDRIAVRVAYRHLSRRRPAALDLESIAEPGGPRNEPFEQTMAREGVRRLYDALAQLPAAGRIAFTLHAIDGRPVAEVAELVGASVTATKLRIWRARRALQKRAAEDAILREFLTDAPQPEPNQHDSPQNDSFQDEMANRITDHSTEDSTETHGERTI